MQIISIIFYTFKVIPPFQFQRLVGSTQRRIEAVLAERQTKTLYVGLSFDLFPVLIFK